MSIQVELVDPILKRTLKPDQLLRYDRDERVLYGYRTEDPDSWVCISSLFSGHHISSSDRTGTPFAFRYKLIRGET